MATEMATDGGVASTLPPPPQLQGDAQIHAEVVPASVAAEGAPMSLVELHAMPLSATSAAVDPPRAKRKYTKRKKTAEAAKPKRKKRKKRNDELQKPRQITRRVLRGVGMSRKELEEKPQNMEELHRRHVLRLEREERFKRWCASKPDLPPHMKRELPSLPEVTLPDPKIVQRVERKIHFDIPKRCQCEGCKRDLRSRPKQYQYTCRVFGCKQRFDDPTDFLEHQIDQHAMLAPYCKRVCEEVSRHQAENLLPPLTVYMGMQYMHPGYRPTLWTMEQLEEEHDTLEARLIEAVRRVTGGRIEIAGTIWRPFQHAYNRVKQFGAAELHEQFKIALEHYESSLVFPVATRNRQDVFSTIGVGRNWLLSPEPENAERSQLLKALGVKVNEEKSSSGKHVHDASDDETDDEVVLFEYGAMPEAARPSEKETEPVSPVPPKGKDFVVSVSLSRDEMPGNESEPDVIMI